MKIVAIIGSLRKNSFNRQLAMKVKEIIGDKAEFEIIEHDDVPLMNQDIEYPAPESVVRIREKIKSCDGIWIFTPEYNHSIPGVLKNLIDWLSRPISETEGQVLSGKPIALSGVGLGIAGTSIAQEYLVATLSFLNTRIMNVPRITIPSAWKIVDESENINLEEYMPYIEHQVTAFLGYLDDNKKV